MNHTPHTIDGRALSRKLRLGMKSQVDQLKAKGVHPCLAVILVGQDAASAVYVRNKVKACEEIGLRSIMDHFPSDLSQEALLARIEELNSDAAVHGILVQLPLPAHIDAHKVIETISPEKDVDGFHVANAGALATGLEGFWPCTPYGCMKILEEIGYDLKGKHAVIVGRSNIVGKPMGLILLQKNATVTICHSATLNLPAMTRQADVLVAAVGRPKMITGDMVKEGAVVLDVGINRLSEAEGGGLCGDVDFESVKNKASYITPVPGGVGPMTITMLLANTVDSAQRTLNPSF